jgi:hypothetical protein
MAPGVLSESEVGVVVDVIASCTLVFELLSLLTKHRPPNKHGCKTFPKLVAAHADT